MRLCIAVLSTLTLLACTPPPAASEPLIADPPASTFPQTIPPGNVDAGAHGEGLVGWWTSDGCGPRKYRRTLELRADGTFRSDDIVSPCPGECVVQWTVQRFGTWTFQDNEIHLRANQVVDQLKQESEAQPLPSELVIDKGSVVEQIPQGPRCPYTH